MSANLFPKSVRPVRRGRGFSLVELMVGVAVGLLSTVVIATILARSEQQKRNSSAGSDAQIAGSLALYEMERSLRSGGYGLTTDVGGMGCTLTANFKGSAAAGAPANVVPALIVPGADGAPPSLTVMRITTSRASLPAPVRAPYFNPTGGGSVSNTVVVNTTMGMAANDLLLVVRPPADVSAAVGTCTVMQASALLADGISITRTEDAAWNGAGVMPSTLQAGDYVVDMGDLEALTFSIDRESTGSSVYQLNLNTYSLASRTSTVRNLQNGVVDFRVLYGFDTSGSGVASTFNTSTPTTANGWRSLRAIRLAVLARSVQFEKDVVTSSAPLWNVGTAATVSGAVDCGSSKCIAMRANLKDADDEEWKHYRYKLFDMVIPLNNQIWHSD
ncbi:MAG TPA: PilW family protein [Burkholderiaceae bacterium]|nr:PilW family protein [Burkholderiaceae bacterium]